jgi:hypothetical protein
LASATFSKTLSFRALHLFSFGRFNHGPWLGSRRSNVQRFGKLTCGFFSGWHGRESPLPV